MNFDVEGPFDLSLHTPKNLITEQTKKDLIDQLEIKRPGLSKAVGCYVFSVRAGKGYTPHYVGQACKLSIPGEALNFANCAKYNKRLAEIKKGTAVIFLITQLTPTGKLRKQSINKSTTINFMEEWLIANALGKNSKLINTQKTRFLRNI